VTDEWSERANDHAENDGDVGLIGGGGPAATIDDDDESLDEHGENLREVDPGDR
jgi:hypothetical protein